VSFRKRFEDFNKIAESTVWSSSPEIVSQKTVETIIEVLGCDHISIHILDDSGILFNQQISHGEVNVDFPGESRIPITTGRMLRIMKTHQPIMMDYQHPDPADQLPTGTPFRSAISVPLLAGDIFVGLFSMNFKLYRRWTSQEIDYLMRIGRLVGVSVHQAQIAQKKIDLEILMERKRLSAELHDNLSQLLGSLNLASEAALLSMEVGDEARHISAMEKIRSMSRAAMQSLRDEMISLYTPMSESKGLIPEIKDSLSRFEEQWGITTELMGTENLDPLIVSTQMELQLVRILHESLSNILRHSKATHVAIRLQVDQRQLILQIQDDGCGFNPDTVTGEHLGIRIMRERAESVGGVFSIEAGNGQGTTIQVMIPMYR
jgi:two-component system nitrate/nitrite sensor histidine kinase NarX